MSVFIVEGNRVRPSPHALTLSPFKDIWERDEEEGKGRAITEFSYIEFMLSYAKTNVFRGYAPDRRRKVIIEKLFPENSDWKPDALVLKAMEAYKKFQEEGSLAMRFYNANRDLLEKMIDYYNNIDLTERTRAGTPVFKPKDITNAVKDMEETLKAMNSAEERVREELYEAAQTTKNRETNPFETGSLVV